MGPLEHVKLNLVQTTEDAHSFMLWLGERREVLGVDTETSGFSPEREVVRLAQFGDHEMGWAMPWDLWKGTILEAITKYDREMVLHNSKFDTRFITRHGNIDWPWHLTNDTMTMAHLVDPLRPKGLKPLAALHIDRGAALSQRMLDEQMKEHKWTWATVPIDLPLYWMYAALDPVLTAHMYTKFKPEIDARYKYPYEIEMGTTRIVAGMEARGARVDIDYSTRKRHDLLTYTRQARDYLRERYGIANATSNQQVTKALHAEGVTWSKTTDSGAPSLDKEVLQSLDHDIAVTLLNIRKAEKMVGPYFDNFISMADENERVHPNIWTMGTRTARMSITDPALQTLPRKDPTVRTAFIPSEGNVLITSDYDQIEARLTAHFSKDQGLVEAFAAEEDFFCAIGGRIYGEKIVKSDPRRQLVKNTIYGKIYVAGIPTMARTAGVPEEQMAAVVATFDSMFPGVRKFQQEVDRKARQRKASEGNAYVHTPTGRRMVSDDHKEYTLVNYLIQCHAAEILKRKMNELDNIGMGQYMILPVHDELVFDLPAEDSVDALKVIEETMADHETYAVPITSSGDILTSDWGEKYR